MDAFAQKLPGLLITRSIKRLTLFLLSFTPSSFPMMIQPRKLALAAGEASRCVRHETRHYRRPFNSMMGRQSAAAVRTSEKRLLVRSENCAFVTTGRPLWMSTDSGNDTGETSAGDAVHNFDGAPRSERKDFQRGGIPDGSSRALLLGQFFPFVWGTTKVFAGCAALAMGLLYINQEKMLYLPEIDGLPRQPGYNPRGYRSPKEYNIPFENHMIQTDDGVSINAWFLLHPQSREKRLPTIIFFHGNAGNIGIRLPNAKYMYELLDANVLMVEYRGYGDSDDVKPNESGLKLDAEAAYRFATSHPNVEPSRIFIFGRSLGGAVGFHLAQHAERNGSALAGLIVENTFISVGRMVDVVLPLLSPLKGLILRMNWDSKKIARKLKIPILYLAGEADEIVPHSHMKELYEMSTKSSTYARMHVVEGGSHNETWEQGGRLYWETIKTFLSESLARREGK